MMQEKENNDTKQTLAQEKLSHYYENIRSNVFSLLGESSLYKQIIYSGNEHSSNRFYVEFCFQALQTYYNVADVV
jgi:hypothetical protein